MTGQPRRVRPAGGDVPGEEAIAEFLGITVERVHELLTLSQDTISLEQPMGDESDFALGDVIEDRGAVSPGSAAEGRALIEALSGVLDQLGEREREIVRLRFGLEDGKIRTLDEVGKEFGVTKERVRQIEAMTLAKLRRPEQLTTLRDFLDED